MKQSAAPWDTPRTAYLNNLLNVIWRNRNIFDPMCALRLCVTEITPPFVGTCPIIRLTRNEILRKKMSRAANHFSGSSVELPKTPVSFESTTCLD